MTGELAAIKDKELRRYADDLVRQGWAARHSRHGVLMLCPCPGDSGRSPHSFTIGGTVNDKGRRRQNLLQHARRCPSTSTSTSTGA